MGLCLYMIAMDEKAEKKTKNASLQMCIKWIKATWSQKKCIIGEHSYILLSRKNIVGAWDWNGLC